MYEFKMDKFDDKGLSDYEGVRFDDNQSKDDSDVGCEVRVEMG